MTRNVWIWIFALFMVIGVFCLLVYLRDNKMDHEIIGRISKIPHFDKLGHFLMMGAISICAISGTLAYRPHSGWKTALGVLIFVMLLSGIEELLQGITPRRTVSFADYAASVAGILFFGSFAYLWQRRKLQSVDT